MRRMTKLIIPLLLVIGLLAACGGTTQGAGRKSQDQSERDARDRSVAAGIANAAAHSCDGQCPTRATINFWIDTWKVPGQLAFTYIRTANPEDNGYYVFAAPPVSMCAALTPTFDFKSVDAGGENGGHMDVMVPARSVDGVYYSGGQCASYYGKDASTGAYIEFSVGQGQNYFLSTQPLPRVSTKALGPTDAAQVTCGDPGQVKTPVCKVKA